ncbi:MAG TPA: pitrilysin family protein [Tepidisphaeraceae bacterium]
MTADRLRRFVPVFLFSVALIACAPTLRADDARPAAAVQPEVKPAAVAPIEFQTQTLDNGLRVVYAPLRQAPVVHVRVFYHVGSRDEKPDRQGFAHMFEHMMFRGSAHVPPEEHMKLINGVGGISNAFTSFDQTTYVDTIPKEATEMALWLEADRMSSFKVTDSIYQIERRVVAQEWAMRMNQPYGNLYEEFLKLAFTRSHYQWTPIGNMEHLKAASADELQTFFNTYYVPNNAILVIAGDIDVARTREWVQRYFAWIPKGNDPPRLNVPEPQQTAPRRSVVPANVPLPAVVIGVHIPDYRSDERYAFATLEAILGSGRSSRLNRRLVSGKDALCAEAQSLNIGFEDSGVFGVFGMVLAGKSADDVEKALKEELTNVAEKGVTDDELAKAKTQARLGILHGRKTAEDIARNVGEEWLFGNDPNRVNTELEKIEKLTAADLQAVARKYFTADGMTILQMVPDTTGQLAKNAMNAARGAAMAGVTPAKEPVKPRVTEFPADYPAKAPAVAAIGNAQFNKGEESTVNGLKVVTISDHRLPLAGFTLALRRGSYSEPRGKEGLAALTAEMLRRGAGGIAYDKLNETLDSKGIAIGVSDGGDHTNLVVTFPAEQEREALRLATQVLQKPDFPQDQFDNLKTQAINNLVAELADPDTVSQREINRRLWGDSPLGRSSTPESLASITLQDVKDFYATYYKPGEAILVAAGDLSPDTGKTIAQQLVPADASSAANLPPAPDLQLPPHPDKRDVLLVDNPGARQAAIQMAVPAYTVHSDEKFAGSLANQILSGGIEARVMKYVRAQKGLAYHAHAVFMPQRVAGTFVCQTGTDVEKSADAIQAMFEVLEGMRKENVTGEELADAKRRVAGGMVMQMQTIDQQAGRRLEGILNGYPADYWDKYPQRVAQVSADQIRQVMQKYATPDTMQIVVVAPADPSKPKLSALGEVRVEPMPAKKAAMLKDARP